MRTDLKKKKRRKKRRKKRKERFAKILLRIPR